MPNYVIEPTAPDSTLRKRLVAASNPARALSHVVAGTFTVRVAQPADYIEYTKAGIELEKATKEPA